MHANYPTKKALKAAVGERLRYTETSMFGPEYRETGKFAVCNPKHTWFAEVTMRDGLIEKVT